MAEHFETRAGWLAAALDDCIRSSVDVEAAALLSLGEQAAIGLVRGQLSPGRTGERG